jgi:hypothetical protein
VPARSLEDEHTIQAALHRLEVENRSLPPYAAKTLGPFLCERGDVVRTYAPMSREYATLFRTFADLDFRDPLALGGFAKRYGRLGLSRQDPRYIVRDRHPLLKKSDDRYHQVVGESHLHWAQEICQLREALRLVKTPTAAEKRADRDAWKRLGEEPPYENRRFRLAWLFNIHLQHVQARFINVENNAPRISFAPLTLLAAMWLQLALSVAGDKEFRACKLCRRLFEISTDETGYRKHREFCSDSCKTKDYRKRRRSALRLLEQGKTAAAIAAEIDTDRATVKRWLDGARATARKGRA